MEIPYINKILKGERRKKEITQQEFSKLISKSLPTIKRYDTGAIIPEEVLKKMCDVLNIEFLLLLKKQHLNNVKTSNKDYEILIKKYHLDIEVKTEISKEQEKIIDRLHDEMLEKLLPKLDEAFKVYDFENIHILERELKKYLIFKEKILSFEETETERNEKIKKIFSFIDLLYFQDIIKK